jgi:hypothetical protein
LGPWGDTTNSVDNLKVVVSCVKGFRQWNITHGSMIDLMTFSCESSSESSVQVGRDLVDETTVHVSLAQYQSITGFQVSANMAGIHGISIEYTDFPVDRNVDRIAFLWGFLTMSGVILLAGIVIVSVLRVRRKIIFGKLDLETKLVSRHNADITTVNRSVPNEERE